MESRIRKELRNSYIHIKEIFKYVFCFDTQAGVIHVDEQSLNLTANAMPLTMRLKEAHAKVPDHTEASVDLYSCK